MNCNYANTNELSELLKQLNVSNILTSEGLTKLNSTPDRLLLARWNSKPDRVNQYNLFPPEFRCVINSMIMLSRSLCSAIDCADYDKINVTGFDRLNSPEIFVGIQNDTNSKYYTPNANMDDIRSLLSDVLTSFVDNGMTDDECVMDYLTYLDRSKAGLSVGIRIPGVLMGLYRELTTNESNPMVELGNLMYSYINSYILEAIYRDIELLYADKYVFIAECYQLMTDESLASFLKLYNTIELLHK